MLLAVLTISDRCSQGLMADTAGPAVAALLRTQWPDAELRTQILPDDEPAIAAALELLAAQGAALILTAEAPASAPATTPPKPPAASSTAKSPASPKPSAPTAQPATPMPGSPAASPASTLPRSSSTSPAASAVHARASNPSCLCFPTYST